MAKKDCKPAEYLSPVPAVMVSCEYEGVTDIVTLAWVGTVNSVPPLVTTSVRRNRFSHPLIEKSGEFVINLVDEKLAKAMDCCGMVSGADVDKWEKAGLTKEEAGVVGCPAIQESLIQLECKVREKYEYESHDAFIGEIVNVRIDESLLKEDGSVDWNGTKLVALNYPDRYFLLEAEQFAEMGFSLK